MRRLKNWTVIMKSISQKNKDNVKSFLNLYEYIYDLKNQHPNHNLKEFHKVVGFEDRHPQIFKNFASLQMKMNLQRSFQKGKKASGRKSSYGRSILLSLPSSIQLEEKDYKRIRDLILIRLVNFISAEYKLNYDKSQRDRFINNYILSTAHLQNSNNHINILVPNVFIDYNNENKLIRVDLGKRKVSYFIKKSFNYIMLNYFNKNYLDYEIQAHAHKISKKVNSQFNYKIKQLEEQKKDLTHQISNMKNLFNLTNENLTKLQKRVDIYLNRMDTAIQEQNKEKFEKNKELIEKNLEKIKEELQKDYSKQEIKPDLLSIFDKIKIELENKSYTNTNTKSGLTR